MVQKELLGLGVQEAGCNLTNAAYHVEIKAADDIGLINQVLGCIRVIGKDADILGPGQPHKVIRSRIRDYHYDFLALALKVMIQAK